MQIISGIILAIASLFDIKNKKVPVVYINGCLALALVIAIVSKNADIINIVIGIIPGIVVFIISNVLEGVIGKADGLVIVMIGLLLGIKELCLILMLSFAIAAVVSVVLIGVFRKGRDTTLPFIPFLLAGQIIAVAIV